MTKLEAKLSNRGRNVIDSFRSYFLSSFCLLEASPRNKRDIKITTLEGLHNYSAVIQE